MQSGLATFNLTIGLLPRVTSAVVIVSRHEYLESEVLNVRGTGRFTVDGFVVSHDDFHLRINEPFVGNKCGLSLLAPKHQ